MKKNIFIILALIVCVVIAFSMVSCKDTEEESALVDGITLNNDAAITDKGIYIGSQKSEVINAYGQPAEENENNIKYKDGGAELVFGFKDGKVNSITLEQKGQNYSSNFSVKYKGTEIKLGTKWSDIEDKLGEPISNMPTGNCGGKGETYRYDYSALTIKVVKYTDN